MREVYIVTRGEYSVDGGSTHIVSAWDSPEQVEEWAEKVNIALRRFLRLREWYHDRCQSRRYWDIDGKTFYQSDLEQDYWYEEHEDFTKAIWSLIIPHEELNLLDPTLAKNKRETYIEFIYHESYSYGVTAMPVLPSKEGV